MNTKIILADFGIYRGFSLSEIASNIRVSLTELPKIHKIDLTDLRVSVDLHVDNPSKERITVKIPSVRLSYKGKLLASTAIRTYTVEPVSTGKIAGIIIEGGIGTVVEVGDAATSA